MIYLENEIYFQLDGHFWLQYGLYLADRGRLSDAVDKLRQSIYAYPDNQLAIHAHADVQLRLAKEQEKFDTATQNLMKEAVTTLLAQDARQHLAMDTYPIVTLSYGHISTLVRHGQEEEAKTKARQYFDRLKELDKTASGQDIREAMEFLIRYLTAGSLPQQGLRKMKARKSGKP